jgi:hypothetical protein
VMLTVSLLNRYPGLLYVVLCHAPVAQIEALTATDQNHVAVRLVASAKEHPLITTNPAELYTV